MINHRRGVAQNVIVIIIVLIAFIVGGVVYFLNSRVSSERSNNRSESYFSAKVSDMFKQGAPLECSSEVVNSEGSLKAVYYFDNQNEMVRVEMEMVDNNSGSIVNTVSIIRDGWNYFWDDLMNKDGMKVKFDKEEDSILPDEDFSLEDVDPEFDFVCKDWSVNPRTFDIPKDKSFKDLSDMMGGFDGLLETSSDSSTSPEPDYGGGTQNLCDMCNFLPDGPEKTECLNSCQ